MCHIVFIIFFFFISMSSSLYTNLLKPPLRLFPKLHNFHTLSSTKSPILNKSSRQVILNASTSRLFGRSNPSGDIRLDRLLANRGHGSRADVEKYIRSGIVSLNGSALRSGKLKVPPDSLLEITGLGTSRPLPTLIAFNKPAKVLTDITTNDGLKRDSLSSYLPPTLNGFLPLTDGLYHPVGRLDYDTKGLLLFSNDGGKTQDILGGKKVWKRYKAECKWWRDEKEEKDLKIETMRLKALIEGSGVIIKDKGKERSFTGLLHSFDYDAPSTTAKSVLELSINTGVYRQVRRMLANVGWEVVQLERVKIGGVELGDLKEGEWRPVEEGELEKS